MYSVSSLLNASYFVFGFKDKEKTKPLLGIVDKDKRKFVIDYSGESTKEAYKSFVDSNERMTIVKMDGVEKCRYSDVQNFEYIKDRCFFIDTFSCGSLDDEDKGFIEIDDCNSVVIDTGLCGNYVWSTGRVFEMCKFRFTYDDFFEDFCADIGTLKNVFVVRKGDRYEDITI